MTEITKQKKGKTQWNLLLGPLANALEAMVKVREYGNEKYLRIAAEAGVPFDSESWRDNDAAAYVESACRHIMAVQRGERINEADGGCEHLAQAMIDLGFALEIERQGGPRRKTEDINQFFLWGEGDGSDRQYITADVGVTLPRLRALHGIRRWAGWGDPEKILTVLQHCILVGDILADQGLPEETIRAGLLHDYTEAVLGDVAGPIKRLEDALIMYPGNLSPRRQLENVLARRLEARVGLPEGLLDCAHVKNADRKAQAVEAGWRGVERDEIRDHYGEDIDTWRTLEYYKTLDVKDWIRMYEANGGKL